MDTKFSHRALGLFTIGFLHISAACDQGEAPNGSESGASMDDGDDGDETPSILPLVGYDLFPEGIVATSAGELLITGFGNGSILRVSADDQVEVFKASGADGLSSAVGLVVDESHERLWVANFSFETFSSNMKVFDLQTGALLATLDHPDDGLPHFFNEVTLDASGRIYVSDTTSPTIWTADPELEAVEVFVTDPILQNPDPNKFGLNGLTLTPDGRYLIASIMDRITQGDGRLARVDVMTKEVTEVSLSGAAVDIFGGGDGILFAPDGDLLMVNVTPPAAIVTATFTDDFTAAELVERGAFDADFNRPTAPAIRGDRLWVVNSQLDHIIDDQNSALGTPPDLPFSVTGVSLNALLED